jgi:hypothetical protein
VTGIRCVRAQEGREVWEVGMRLADEGCGDGVQEMHER